MSTKISRLDRRRFLRGTGVALALPLFHSLQPCTVFAGGSQAADEPNDLKRLACFYFPDGVPMPLAEDPAYQDWSWFPHGGGRDFTFSKCMEPLDDLKDDLTVLSGFSHPAARAVHGHNNADQFLTAAVTGGGDTDYQNSISLDQEFAKHVGRATRFSSLVMSTDGGTGTARGAHTLSFNQHGKPIPAEHRPKQIFDRLFVTSNVDAARQLAIRQSALDDLMLDAQRLRKSLSAGDRLTLDEYLDSIREAEVRVAKAKRWIDTRLPSVDADHLDLELTPDEPRQYLQTMFELIYLAFKTDSTRVATYQIGRENGVGKSDHLARAVGYSLAHQLSHETKKPGGWEAFGTYCRFLNEEYGRFISKLKATPEPAGTGSMLDNTVVLFGSASSAFHLSRNYPLILAGGKQMGFRHGQYLNFAGANAQGGAWAGGKEPWQETATHEDRPLAEVFATILLKLGVETSGFAGSTAIVKEI